LKEIFYNILETLIEKITLNDNVDFKDIENNVEIRLLNDKLVEIINTNNLLISKLFLTKLLVFFIYVNNIKVLNNTLKNGNLNKTNLLELIQDNFLKIKTFKNSEFKYEKMIAVMHCYDMFETAYISTQILNNHNIFDKIVLCFPKNGKYEYNSIEKIKNISDKIEIKFINNLRDINIKDMYSADVIYDYFYKKEFIGYDYTLILYQDTWLLDINKFKKHFENFKNQDCEIMSYYTCTTGDVATDFFLLKNCENVRNYFIANEFKNIGRAQFEYIFGNGVQNNLKCYFYNTKETKIHQYGYSSVTGKVHLHTYVQKKYYIDLYEKYYNIKVDYDNYLLSLEDNKSNKHDIQHKHLAGNFEDNGAICQ